MTLVFNRSKLSGLQVARCALAVQLLSWSLSYCMSRTLANSTETAIVIIVLNALIDLDCKSSSGKLQSLVRHSKLWQLLPDDFDTSDVFPAKTSSIALILVAVSSYCRPTALLFWVGKRISTAVEIAVCRICR